MKSFENYLRRLQKALEKINVKAVEQLSEDLARIWKEKRQVFICGNGGSAANAMHIANDLLFGIAKNSHMPGMKVHALTANAPIMTCLANDISYGEIFSEQLKVYGAKGDLLLVLSGSGNSGNIVKAVETAKRMGIRSYGVLGYSGGRCLEIIDVAIHTAVDDMQISEDIQLIIGHMVMQELYSQAGQNI